MVSQWMPCNDFNLYAKAIKARRTNPLLLQLPSMMTPLSHLLLFLFAASVAAIAIGVQPSHAHMKGMYATKAEAEARAVQLKCEGVFKIGNEWMPCANERALHDALKRE